MTMFGETEKADSLTAIRSLRDIECGTDAAQHFLHDPGYVNLNHGSYGTYPKAIQAVHRHYQHRAESRPDFFVRYEYRPRLLKESREAIADYLNVPPECCVYVPNASTGIDTVLLNLDYQTGDVIIGFSSMYDSILDTAQHIAQSTPAEFLKIDYAHPEDDELTCEAFENAIKQLVYQGKNPKVAVFDTVSSLPALRMPFERLTRICRSHDVLSLIDGAHGVGMLPLDLQQLDADFFVSNCHKWLYTPRACAVLHVPLRNQHLLKQTFPTGFGFAPFPKGEKARKDLPNNFVSNFADLGTRDETPYLCVRAALEWREKLVWEGKRGEEAIMDYMNHLAQQGGSIFSKTLGTEVLGQGSSMTNVRLPLPMDTLAGAEPPSVMAIGQRIMRDMMLEYNTAINVTWYKGALWLRLSAQVYLTLEDFKTAARNLKVLCDRVRG